MLRLDINSTLLDASCFIKQNRLKFIIAFIIIVVGAVIGIMSALNFSEVTIYNLARFNVFLVVTRERSFFGYFLVRFLLLLAMILAMCIVGVRPLTAWLGALFLLAFSYQAFLFITLMFMYNAVRILPLMLLGVIPFKIISFWVLAFFFAYVFCLAKDSPVLRFADCGYYCRTVGGKFFITALVLLIFTVVETALVVLLSIGIY